MALPTTTKVLVLAGLLLGSASDAQSDLELSGLIVPEQEDSLTVLANDKGLSRSQGLLFYKGELFIGKVETFDAAGVLRIRSRYDKGRRHGACERWYSNGGLESVRAYRENLKHGRHRGWFEAGQRKFLMHFDRGRYAGERKEWYASGQAFAHFRYKEGEENGLQRVWGPTGKLRSNFVVKNGRRYGLIGAKPCVSVPDLSDPLVTEVFATTGLKVMSEPKKEMKLKQ